MEPVDSSSELARQEPTPGPSRSGVVVSGRSVSDALQSEEREGASLSKFLLAAFPLAFLIALMFVDVPICPTKRLFGLPCPGCGLTRATYSMVTLDFATMWAMHPLAPIITPMVAWMLGRSMLVSAGFLRARSFDPLSKIPVGVWIALVVVLLGTWIGRLALGIHPDGFHFEEGWLYLIYQGV